MKILKTYWNERTRNEKELIVLWSSFIISFLLDEINCTYLAWQYNCSVSDLWKITDFYWLSPIFGIIDLLIGISIFRKVKVSSEIVVRQFVFNFSGKSFIISVPKINGLTQKALSVIVIIISVCSLIGDIGKFFM